MMRSEPPEDLLYEGIGVDIAFGEPRPSYGDLYCFCGALHPRFPPTGDFGFDRLDDLQFDQVDDYFGVRSLSGEGDDVQIWLYPLVDGEAVHHHPGPFDGVRLEYSILRNPAYRFDHFVKCVLGFAALGSGAVYRNRGEPLGSPADLSPMRKDFDAVVQHWAERGITVGSDKALKIDH